MIKLKEIVEDLRSKSDEYFYHVTLAPYTTLIQKEGLRIHRKSTVTNYSRYSKGKLFFTDVGTLDWWISTIAAHAFHEHDDERFHDIVVFRVKKTDLPNIQVDTEGSNDSRGESYYVTHDVPPNVVEFVKIEKSPY